MRTLQRIFDSLQLNDTVNFLDVDQTVKTLGKDHSLSLAIIDMFNNDKTVTQEFLNAYNAEIAFQNAPTADDIADDIQEIEYTEETENVTSTGDRIYCVTSILDSVEMATYNFKGAQAEVLHYEDQKFSVVIYESGKFYECLEDCKKGDTINSMNDPHNLIGKIQQIKYDYNFKLYDSHPMTEAIVAGFIGVDKSDNIQITCEEFKPKTSRALKYRKLKL